MTIRKLMPVFLTLTLCVSCLLFTGCGSNGEDAQQKIYKVGISQLMAHSALDEATNGFKDALTDELGEGNVEFSLRNAYGLPDNCATIAYNFASSKVDLIMANGTSALQAAANATSEIPILGTSITEYGVALSIDDFNGTVGRNISGTSDLAPLDEQAQMILDLIPDARTVGMLYCSAEANSAYQVKVVREYLEGKGVEVKDFAFSSAGDIAEAVEIAAECDAIYIPTDNTAAACKDTISKVAEEEGVPIITGGEALCSSCGIATLSISYYELGYKTGLMAARILRGEEKVEEMPIEYAADPAHKYHKQRCEALGIAVPAGYTPLGG